MCCAGMPKGYGNRSASQKYGDSCANAATGLSGSDRRQGMRRLHFQGTQLPAIESPDRRSNSAADRLGEGDFGMEENRGLP